MHIAHTHNMCTLQYTMQCGIYLRHVITLLLLFLFRFDMYTRHYNLLLSMYYISYRIIHLTKNIHYFKNYWGFVKNTWTKTLFYVFFLTKVKALLKINIILKNHIILLFLSLQIFLMTTWIFNSLLKNGIFFECLLHTLVH